jgi:hypothetical protein
MPVTGSGLPVALARYARRFHQVAGAGHHVASPLGAWLLLALAGPACAGDDLRQLEEILGADAGAAAGFAAELLASPHPLVHAAAAVWSANGSADARIASWRAGLPSQVDTGPVPGQAELDAWARRHTLGLIDRFPVKNDGTLIWLLATALATRVSWERPFDLAPASALGPSSPWSARLSRVLRTPGGPGHEQFVAATEAAGDVAMHTAHARGGLLVTSVAAAPDVPAAKVMAVAYDLAMARAARGTAVGATAAGGTVAQRSLFDLPLGEAPLWTISEGTGPVKAASGREERCTAVLPAWSARSQYALTNPDLGFAAAARALSPGGPWQARQAAMARYGREGFEAGAVTALGISLAMLIPNQGVVRTAELRFGHPYAVVAVTVDEPGKDRQPAAAHGPWNGMPVFSAWVAQPEDAAA